jgi:hypothetical protein
VSPMQSPLVPKAEAHLRAALRLAFEELVQDGVLPIQRHMIVFRALEDAMETLRKLPDREARWLKGHGSWPSLVPADDHVKADMPTQLIAILAGVLAETGEEDERALRRANASREEVSRMEIILEVLRESLVGQKRRRDWKVLCFTALGKGQRFVARAARTSTDSVRKIKHVQTLALGKALADFMPIEFDAAEGRAVA